MRAPEPLKEILRKTGLRKPVGMLVSPKFRQVVRITERLKGDFRGRGFERIYNAHIDGTDGYKKYLDLDHALEPAIKWFLHLKLHQSRTLRIFDIGCGPG